MNISSTNSTTNRRRSLLKIGRNKMKSPGMLIFFLALLVRLSIWVVFVPEYGNVWGFGGGDGITYYRLSTLLSWPFDDPAFLLRPPGYPAEIAFVSIFVTDAALPVAVTLVNAVLSSVTAYLSYRLALALGLKYRHAIIAGILVAIHPTLAFYGITPLAESLFSVLLMMALLATLLARKNNENSGALGLSAGLLIGIATLVKPITLLLAPFAMLYWLIKLRRRASVIASLAVIVVVIPWAVHNYQVWGVADFSNAATYNMLFLRGSQIVNSATGEDFVKIRLDLIDRLESKLVGQDITPAPDRFYRAYSRVTDPVRLSAMRSLAISLWVEHPVASLTSMIRGVYATHLKPPGEIRTRVPSVISWLIFAELFVFLGLGVLGSIIVLNQTRSIEILAIAVTVGYLGLTVVSVHGGGDSRFSYPELPVLAVFVASGAGKFRTLFSSFGRSG